MHEIYTFQDVCCSIYTTLHPWFCFFYFSSFFCVVTAQQVSMLSNFFKDGILFDMEPWLMIGLS